jgi:hypothetical protein
MRSRDWIHRPFRLRKKLLLRHAVAVLCKQRFRIDFYANGIRGEGVTVQGSLRLSPWLFLRVNRELEDSFHHSGSRGSVRSLIPSRICHTRRRDNVPMCSPN